MTAIDMTKPSLRALAKALRGPMPKGFTWNFGQLCRTDTCGSVGCAIGLAKTLWPKAFPDLYDDLNATDASVAERFNISVQQVKQLFWIPQLHGQTNYADVTPSMVADTIDKFLASQ